MVPHSITATNLPQWSSQLPWVECALSNVSTELLLVTTLLVSWPREGDCGKIIESSGALLPSNLWTCPVVGLIQIPYLGQLSSESCPKYSLGMKSVAIGQEPSIKSAILEICPPEQWTKWNRDRYQPMCQLTETARLFPCSSHLPRLPTKPLQPHPPPPALSPDNSRWLMLTPP